MNQAAQQGQGGQGQGGGQPRRDYQAEQREYDAEQASMGDGRDDEDQSDGSEPQPIETRPITINPGAPES